MNFGMPFLTENRSLEEACVLCRELGLAFVELNANFPACQTERLTTNELRTLRDAYGVYFTLHAEEELDPFSFNPHVRAAWLDSFREELRLARVVGMPIVNMHLPHGVYITLPGEKVYLYARYAQEYLAALLDFRNLCEEELQGSCVHIAIENTDGFLPHEQNAVDVLLESKVFGLTLDIGHLHGAGETDLPFFLARRHRLIHMHGHDARGRKNHLALGDGEVPLRERLAWAKESGSRVVLETKTAEALRTSVARLPTYLQDAKYS